MLSLSYYYYYYYYYYYHHHLVGLLLCFSIQKVFTVIMGLHGCFNEKNQVWISKQQNCDENLNETFGLGDIWRLDTDRNRTYVGVLLLTNSCLRCRNPESDCVAYRAMIQRRGATGRMR